MFRSIQVSAILAAAVLIAAPGCCSTNGLLCSHSSPSEETVVADYSGGYVENYSTGCSECGCGCGVAADTETFYSGNASPTAAEVVDADKYLIGTPIDQGEVARLKTVGHRSTSRRPKDADRSVLARQPIALVIE